MKKITLMIMFVVCATGFSQNLLTNGDFAAGAGSWTFTGGGGAVVAGEASFATSNAGGNPWDTQLVQGGLSFTSGRTYTLSFKARAVANRNIAVAIQNVGTWEDQFRQSFALTTTAQTFTRNFNATFTNANVQIGFLMGAVGSTEGVFIDDVSLVLVPVAPAPLDLLLGFETTESGGIDGPPFGGMAAPVLEAGTGTNTTRVLKIVGNPTVATGIDVWQGINLNLTSNVNLTTTKTMTIDVKSATPIYFLSKVTRGLSGAPIAAAPVYHNGDNTWQTLTFVFDTALDGQAASANGVYQGFVIHAYWAAGATAFTSVTRDTRTFYVDNIRGPLAVVVPTCTDGIMNGTETGVDCGGTCPACPQPPTVAAPTPPARPIADVLSVFSDAYTNVTGTTWGPNWGPSSTVVDDITIATNPTKRANMTSGKTFFGVVLTNFNDLSTFTHFHVDYWIPSPVLAGQVLSFKLSNHDAVAPATGESSAIQTVPIPVAGSWVSLDVPLADFITAHASGLLSRNKIKEIVVSAARTNGGQTLDFYFDNLYFHKNTVLSSESFSALNVKMYPNPATNVLNIEARAAIQNVSIYNMLGQEVISKTTDNASISIDVAGLQAGMYIIKTTIDGVTAASRFVKQ